MRVHGSGIYIAAILVGVLSGLICVAFRYTVATICSLRPHLFNHSNPLIAHLAVFSTIFIMLSATGWIVRRFPKASGSGLPQTQALLFGRRVYDKPFTYLLVKFAGGIFSLCSGLSLGREGTSVQMGSLTGYITASLLKLPPGKHRHLIAAGAGAGVSAAFTAPLSSSILIMESLQKVTITTTLICTLLAGGTASIIAKFITPGNIYDSIGVAMPANPQWQLMLLFVAMAIFFAHMGRFFSTLLEKGKLIYARSGRSALFHNLLLASVTWTIGLFFTGMIGGDQTFLVNESTINSYLHPGIAGHPLLTSSINILILALIIVIMSGFTILSHSSGYPGGIFLPMMTIGGLLGKLFYDLQLLIAGSWLTVSTEVPASGTLSGYFMLIGMSAFFIAVVRTPLTGFILISEMTGHYEVFFPTLIVGILVYYLTQILKVTPLNDLLYDFMIKEDVQQPQRTTIYIDAGYGSYFHNKVCGELTLPQGCRLVEICRMEKGKDGKPVNRKIPIEPQLAIQEDDSIGIEVNSSEIEQLYRALASFGE